MKPHHSSNGWTQKSIIENRKYSRDSFDRFWDDLCEDIFGYFPLEVIIKYECVSNQWKRTIYQKVKRLRIDRSAGRLLLKQLFSSKQLEGGVPALESLLRKCPIITEFYVSPEPYFDTYPEIHTIIVGFIAKYCQKLKSIENSSVGWSHNSAKTLISSIEHKLGKIILNKSEQNFEIFNGQRFERLRKLKIYFPYFYNLTLFDGSIETNMSFSRLKRLVMNCHTIDEQFLRTIIRSNKGLIYLYIQSQTKTQTLSSEHLLKDLSKLSELKTLGICLIFDLKSKRILKKFKTIGQKCHKLETFGYMNRLVRRQSTQKILSFIEYYPNLVILALNSAEKNDPSVESSNIACQSLHNCLRLKNLYLFDCNLTDSFFEDIHKYVPKLRFLSIRNICVNEVFIDFIGKLIQLQSVIIKNIDLFGEQQIHPEHFHKLFANTSRLKTVRLTSNKERFKMYKSYFGGITQIGPSQTWFILDHLI